MVERKAYVPREGLGRMTARKTPHPIPPADIIRDQHIAALSPFAIKDGAIVAAIIYETFDGRTVIRAHDGSRSTLRGLLREVALMEGVIDE